MNPNPVEWLNKMASEPYYLLHFLTFFSYLITRTSATSVLSPYLTHRLFYREIQEAVLTFALLAAYKIVRDETWEAFISNMLFFAKIFLVAISLIIDYHLTFWYMVVFSVIYLVTQPPAFEKLGTSSKLTPLQLETLLTEGNTSRFWTVHLCTSLDYSIHLFFSPFIFRLAAPQVTLPQMKLRKLFLEINVYHCNIEFDYIYEVEFHALCSSACIRSSRCFPELSITYSNKNLSFGIVDLGLFPNAAEKFGISLSGGLDQLPTYILFENGAEVTSFPEWDYEAKASHPPRVLLRHFELDRHLLEYVNGK